MLPVPKSTHAQPPACPLISPANMCKNQNVLIKRVYEAEHFSEDFKVGRYLSSMIDEMPYVLASWMGGEKKKL